MRGVKQKALIEKSLARAQKNRETEAQRDKLIEEHLQQSIDNRKHPVFTLDQDDDTMKSRQQNQLIEERLKAARENLLAERKKVYPTANGATFKMDEEGLQKAYNDKTYPSIYYDPKTQTEYVAGTRTAEDWYQNVRDIPFWGYMHNNQRYNDALTAYNDLTQRGMPVKRIVGHSLGAQVSHQSQKDKNIPYSRTFGGATVDWEPSFLDPLNLHVKAAQDRFRHPLDPVSVFDKKAQWGPLLAHPHSYGGFQGFDKPQIGRAHV